MVWFLRRNTSSKYAGKAERTLAIGFYVKAELRKAAEVGGSGLRGGEVEERKLEDVDVPNKK